MIQPESIPHHANPSRRKRRTQSTMNPITQYWRIVHDICRLSSSPALACQAACRAATKRITRFISSCMPLDTTSVHSEERSPCQEPIDTLGVRNTAFQYSSASVETATARIRSVRVRPLPRTTHPSSWWLSRRKSAHRTGGGACASSPSNTLVEPRSCCRHAKPPTAYTSSTSCAARPNRATASQRTSSSSAPDATALRRLM
mmetsp:Transcript_29145/g.94730  ORF Transcript_29145/g.94730 Transcript_29145/m.94730 type:complete len:202 (-) Transcript_29145:48-653(-)